jgi:transposase-like protein
MGISCALSAVERQKIQQWIAAHGTPQQVAMRCRIILAGAAGESNAAIAEQLSVNRNTVFLWRKRFADVGLDGLWDIAPARGSETCPRATCGTATVKERTANAFSAS